MRIFINWKKRRRVTGKKSGFSAKKKKKKKRKKKDALFLEILFQLFLFIARVRQQVGGRARRINIVGILGTRKPHESSAHDCSHAEHSACVCIRTYESVVRNGEGKARSEGKKRRRKEEEG